MSCRTKSEHVPRFLEPEHPSDACAAELDALAMSPHAHDMGASKEAWAELRRRKLHPLRLRAGDKMPFERGWIDASDPGDYVGGCNIGIRCGDGVAGADVDGINIDAEIQADPKLADKRDMLADLNHRAMAALRETRFFKGLMVRVGRPGRFLSPCRMDAATKDSKWLVPVPGMRGKTVMFSIQILASGKQFAAFGGYPGLNKNYEWELGRSPVNTDLELRKETDFYTDVDLALATSVGARPKINVPKADMLEDRPVVPPERRAALRAWFEKEYAERVLANIEAGCPNRGDESMKLGSAGTLAFDDDFVAGLAPDQPETAASDPLAWVIIKRLRVHNDPDKKGRTHEGNFIRGLQMPVDPGLNIGARWLRDKYQLADAYHEGLANGEITSPAPLEIRPFEEVLKDKAKAKDILAELGNAARKAVSRIERRDEQEQSRWRAFAKTTATRLLALVRVGALTTDDIQPIATLLAPHVDPEKLYVSERALGGARAAFRAYGLGTSYVEVLKNAQVTYDAENAVQAGERGFKLVENFDGSPAAAVSVALRKLVGETGDFADILAIGGKVFEYSGRTWDEVAPSRFSAAIEAVEGQGYYDEKGKSKTFHMSDHTKTGIRNRFCEAMERDGGLNEPPQGLMLQDRFLRLDDDGKLVVEAPAREHYARFELPFKWSDIESAEDAGGFERYLRDCFDGDPLGEAKKRAIHAVNAVTLFGLPMARPVFVLLIGRAGAGKSVLIETLCRMFPEHALTEIDPTKLGERFVTHDLVGKRLAYAHEVSSRRPISQKDLKTIVDRKPVRTEQKNEKAFMFTPTSQFIFACNETPTFDGNAADEGLRRRLLAIRFLRSQSKRAASSNGAFKLDSGLAARLARKSGAYIVKRALEMVPELAMAAANGFDWPDDIWNVCSGEAAEIASEGDTVEFFVAHIYYVKAAETPSKALYDAYRHLTTESFPGKTPLSAPKFYSRFADAFEAAHGVPIEPDKGAKGARRWKGVALSPQAPSAGNIVTLKPYGAP